MLRDLTIDHLLQGTPAALSNKLRTGDDIVSVDTQPATPENVKRLVVGDAAPAGWHAPCSPPPH